MSSYNPLTILINIFAWIFGVLAIFYQRLKRLLCCCCLKKEPPIKRNGYRPVSVVLLSGFRKSNEENLESASLLVTNRTVSFPELHEVEVGKGALGFFYEKVFLSLNVFAIGINYSLLATTLTIRNVVFCFFSIGFCFPREFSF